SYMAQNRLRRFGYTNTKVLEGGILFYPNLKVMEE
ncbi:putative CoA-disulfide reductase domain protein, partial [Clostridioides difficile CD175]